MSLSHLPKIVTNGLVLCLDASDIKSYPKSGTTWFDRSGNGNNGSLINGVGYSDGPMMFDGENDYIDCGTGCDVSPTNEFTVEFWGLIKSGILSSLKGIICKANSASSGQWYIFLDASPGNAGKLVLRVADTSIFQGYRTLIPYNDNILRHYVFTWKAGSFNCYVNAENKDMESELGSPITTLIASTVNVNIGRRGTGSSAANYFNGNIYSTKVYNRALTPKEISQNFNATRGRYGI